MPKLAAICLRSPDPEAQKQFYLDVPVSAPRQFKDVGFVGHLEDSLGFQIELIDHWFEGDRPEQRLDTEQLGGGPRLSLLTLRCHDAKLIHQVATDLEMAPLCVVPVPDPGFTLYFYGYPSEQPPSSDLHAVENRTWVYRRPFCIETSVPAC